MVPVEDLHRRLRVGVVRGLEPDLVQPQLLEEGLNGLRAHPGAPRSGDGTEGAPLEAPITAEVPRMCGERARGRDLAHRHECKPAFYVSRNPEEEINRTTRVKILADERLGCC